MRLIATPLGIVSDSVRQGAAEVGIQPDSIFYCSGRKKVYWRYQIPESLGARRKPRKKALKADEDYILSMLGRWAMYTMGGEE